MNKELLVIKIMNDFDDLDKLQNTKEKILAFWTELNHRRAFVELGYDKKPKANKNERVAIDNINELIKVYDEGRWELRWSWDEFKLIVWDFDLHKVADVQLRRHYYEAVVRIALDRDLTLVKSKNGGLHLYFDRDENCRHQRVKTVGRVLRCLIPHVDILASGGVVGPDQTRIILNISSRWNTKYGASVEKPNHAPAWLLPLGGTSKGDYSALERFPADLGSCIKKGYRRRSLLSLLRLHKLSDEDIRCINNFVFRPKKEEKELIQEVLLNRPALSSDLKNFSVEDHSWDNFVSIDRDVFAIWNEEKVEWTKYNLHVFNKAAAAELDFPVEVIDKHINHIKDYLIINRNLKRLQESNESNINIFCKNSKIRLSLSEDNSIGVKKLNTKEAKQSFIISEFNTNVNLDNTKKILETINGYNTNVYNTSEIMHLFSEVAPKTWNFLKEKFFYKNQELVESCASAVARLILLSFLKNFKDFKNVTVQKLFIFAGPGGSGKSTLVKLIKSFVYGEDIFAGDLANVGGRFEGNGLKGKTILCFSDEDFSATLQDATKSLSMLKRLSGGDDVRVEEKFGGVSSFVNKGFLLISTNTMQFYQKGKDYASIKRRLQVFHVDKTISPSFQKPQILEDLLESEFLNIAMLAVKISKQVDCLRRDIALWDCETEVLKKQENDAFENQTDMYASFLHDCVHSTKEDSTVFISWDHLFCLFIQYILYRKGSSIAIKDEKKLYSSLVSFMSRHDSPEPDLALYHNTLKSSLSGTSGKENIYQSLAHKFKDDLTSRLPFTQRNLTLTSVKKRVDWNKITYDYKGNEQREKVFSTVFGIRGLVLKSSVLKKLPDEFPVFIQHEKSQWIFDSDFVQNTVSLSTSQRDSGFAIVRHYSTNVTKIDWLDSAQEKLDSAQQELKKLSDSSVYSDPLKILPLKDWFQLNNYLEKIKLICKESSDDLLLQKKIEKGLDSKVIKEEVDKNYDSISRLRFLFSFEDFPRDLSLFLRQSITECIFYQYREFKQIPRKETVLYLSPFLQFIITRISADDNLFTLYKNKCLSEIDKDYKDVKEAAKFKKKFLKKEKLKVIGDFIKDVVYTLTKKGFLLDTLSSWDWVTKKPIQKYVLKLPNVTGLILLEWYAELSKKPMIIPPLNWVRSFDKKKLHSGGYLSAVDFKLPIYHNEDVCLDIKHDYCSKYQKNLNFIQQQPYKVDTFLIECAVTDKLDSLTKDLRTKIEKIYAARKVKLGGHVGTILNRFLHGIVKKINTFVLELTDLKITEVITSNRKDAYLYFPIHIDRIGRMYNQGLLNIINSKFFRRILVVPETSSSDKRVYSKVLQEHLKKIEKEVSQDDLKEKSKAFYSRLPLFSKNIIVFLDATGSMLQIYSLLFGDLNLAKLTNLSSENVQDPVIAIKKTWDSNNEPIEKNEVFLTLLEDRYFLKKVVMLKMYGSGSFGTTGSIMTYLREKKSLSEEDIPKWSEVDAVVKWVEKKIKATFSLIFLLEDALKEINSPTIKLTWQGNKTTYSFRKDKMVKFEIAQALLSEAEIVKERKKIQKLERKKKELVNLEEETDTEEKRKKIRKKEFEIKKLEEEKQVNVSRKRIELKVQDETKVDKSRTLRTILTGIFHSIDASVALKVRLRMQKKYNIIVYSVHDCFGCDASKIEILIKTYKEVLFEEAFDKKLTDVLEVERLTLQPLQAIINERKNSKEWNELRQVYSPHCLKLE